ncbi:hypothetical protein Pmani_033991 [Petrolisthes manimaculis]|uniref:Uncharacterized protein n=1 Tax=Petrolisthes manimaculis TaxID=1843537 RepID=A0AAE1NPI4_9EUCA|nr:hypothetical protein Pmani_033991 [Petrolisthes manimaculis]
MFSLHVAQVLVDGYQRAAGGVLGIGPVLRLAPTGRPSNPTSRPYQAAPCRSGAAARPASNRSLRQRCRRVPAEGRKDT